MYEDLQKVQLCMKYDGLAMKYGVVLALRIAYCVNIRSRNKSYPRAEGVCLQCSGILSIHLFKAESSSIINLRSMSLYISDM